jgi:hypothetical protein
MGAFLRMDHLKKSMLGDPRERGIHSEDAEMFQ